MSARIDSILERIDQLEHELEEEIARKRSSMAYEMKGRRAHFEKETRDRLRQHRVSLRNLILRTKPQYVITAPVIFSLLVPFALLDLWVTLYHQICFRAYGIPRVRRRDHIRIDRHQLAYLNGFQKLYCVYCGYINGLISFVREIGSRTEAFWCPIKHAGKVRHPHPRYAQFLDYGDGEDYIARLDASRRRVQSEDHDQQ
ncbi:hypothetical protein [Tropicibacter oceani]|uniref:Uncharacterized protein n=1 Tax=Tropicibacter oceani TaxID=3058420 RepID=A0ABY8QLG1_9RHOB|nr:hypothetical protein [Tropicibacter oceani]WGW05452.1 hypothetical protein QF118_07865 [Tropicibacter oceani]